MLKELLYVDPGSSSYLLQAIVAAALGAVVYVKTSWWRIKHFFSKKKKTEETDH